MYYIDDLLYLPVFRVLVTVLLWPIVGCVRCQKVVSPSIYRLHTGRVAILPFRNCSNIIGAGERCRAAAVIWMEARSYVCLDIHKIDKVLREKGITDAGQLRTLSCSEIGQLTGADTLLFGDILKFNSYIFFLYNVHTIRIRLNLKAAKPLSKDVHAGDVLWNVTASTSNHRVVNPLLLGILIGAVQLVADHQLCYETQEVVRKALESIPPGNVP